jgi:nicotinate-nucleotide adenylyltransferase
MKIGLYFGTFNPIHNGHLIIANYILQYAKLDQVWLIVSPQNPFKQSHSLLNEYHRLFLVQQALEGETKIKAVDIEFGLPKPSYTINTLAYLQEKYSEHEFGIIMGSDSLHNLDRWKNAELIMKNFSLYVYERQGYPMRDDLDDAMIIDMKAPLLNISSSLIRRMLKEGKSIRYLVPDVVDEEIQKGNYYR